jgi:hypothetical protein
MDERLEAFIKDVLGLEATWSVRAYAVIWQSMKSKFVSLKLKRARRSRPPSASASCVVTG